MKTSVCVDQVGSYKRYMVVNRLDDETVRKAEGIFGSYREKGVILNDAFSDTHWSLTDEKSIRKISFELAETDFHKKGREWSDCTAGCYLQAVRAYTVFMLGSACLDTVCQAARQLLKTATMSREDVMGSVTDPYRFREFLALLPSDSPCIDELMEEADEKIILAGRRKKKGNQRVLAHFQEYLRFDKEITGFWDRASEEDRMFYFPLYLWWKVTTILPLRPTEFILMPRECIACREGQWYITVRRTKLKGKSGNITYTLEGDYERQTYPVTDEIGRMMRWYQGKCPGNREGELDTFFSLDPYYRTGHRHESFMKHRRYFTYEHLYGCLQDFYGNVAGVPDTDRWVRLGDTRHIAMMNLIISGGSPEICRQLAGHADINISSHYYSNMDLLVECSTYELYRRYKAEGKKAMINGRESYPARKPEGIPVEAGICSSEAMMAGDIQDCLKSISGDGEIGACSQCRYYHADDPGLHFDFFDRESAKEKMMDDVWFFKLTVDLVRKGLGLEEDILQAVYRLKQSSTHYRECILEKLKEEEADAKE